MENIKDFVISWNFETFIDRWWREKHKVAFNTPLHRSNDFISMAFEYLEDKMYKEWYTEKDEYIPGEMFKPLSKEQIESKEKMAEEEFMNIDLSVFKNK